MKKTVKKLVALALAVVLCVSFAGCAKINYVTNGTIKAINEVKSGEYQNAGNEAEGEASSVDMDAPVIDEFQTVTCGGVEFKSVEDVVKFYVEAYNYSKTLLVDYIEKDGTTHKYYKLLGEEDLKVENIKIDGKANATINNLVPTIVGSLYSPGLNGLVPSTNRNPELDTDEWDGNGESLTTSRLVADDLVAANVKDNGDGTVTIQLQPKAVNMSVPGKDAQGHVFQSLGAIDATVNNIKQLSWSEGTTADNCKVNYYGGVATVTIDVKSKEIVKADYAMNAVVEVTHANILVIKDKSASLDVKMKWMYPASEEYLMDSKGIKLA